MSIVDHGNENSIRPTKWRRYSLEILLTIIYVTLFNETASITLIGHMCQLYKLKYDVPLVKVNIVMVQ